MMTFHYTTLPATLLGPELTGFLSAIHEYRGKQDLYLATKRDILNSLLKVAEIQSTESSNRIEGICTTSKRLKDLIEEKTTPHNRDEEEIAGYRDVLRTIHENFPHIPITPNTILQLHRDLYAYHYGNRGGLWKNADNLITETNALGEQFVRFKPTPAFETPQAIEDLCRAYAHAIRAELHDPLLLMPMFILDFLSIHPFNDGNGRMSRLLTLLLLYQDSYIVGKYVSLEKIIEQNKDAYYQSLLQSSQGWYECKGDYRPFVHY